MKKRSTTGLSRRQAIHWGMGVGAVLVAAPTVLRAADEVTIGSIVALTGVNSAWGQRFVRGLQLATKQVNESGGIKSLSGAKLRALIVDSESRPDLASSLTERLVGQGICAITGAVQSPVTIIASQVTERMKVPYITATDVDPLITSRGFKFIFRTAPVIDVYAESLISYIRRLADAAGDQPKKLAVLSENTITGQTSLKAAAASAKTHGFDVVEQVSYDASKPQNFSAFLARFVTAGVEVLVGHNKPSDAIQITRTLKELRMNLKAFGGMYGGYLSAEYTKTLGRDADYVLGTDTWTNGLPIPGQAELETAYAKEFNETMDSLGADGFVITAVLKDAIERAKSPDPAAIAEALRKTDLKVGYPLLLQLGGVKFAENGENIGADGLVFQIRDSKRLTVAPEKFAEAKGVYPKPPWS
jgi:branched-chain amino acid transport system substrate-binding protein